MVVDLLTRIAIESYRVLLLASPYLLFGLLAAGFVHVLFPERAIRRWMGKPGMAGVVRAALIGVPLPVCSCGVVPLTVELRRKGASQPASLSFLITTPESSVDSILFTWGLMGPVFAIARPIAAFVTAVVGGLGAMLFLKEKPATEIAPPPDACGCDGRCATDSDSVSEAEASEGGSGPKRGIVPSALHYGFVELLDELAFWIVLGVLVAGALTAVLPSDLADHGLGGGIVPMLIMLAVSVPLYMCASASTPIAAALLAKGVGPGAALVLLLAGPATNAATVVLLGRTFGGRFMRVYLVAVMATALACGLLFELLVGPASVETAPLVGGHVEGLGWLDGISFGLLATLLAWRLWQGGFRGGVRELAGAFRRLLPARG